MRKNCCHICCFIGAKPSELIADLNRGKGASHVVWVSVYLPLKTINNIFKYNSYNILFLKLNLKYYLLINMIKYYFKLKYKKSYIYNYIRKSSLNIYLKIRVEFAP